MQVNVGTGNVSFRAVVVLAVRIDTLPVEGRFWGGAAVVVRGRKAGHMAKGGSVSGSGTV